MDSTSGSSHERQRVEKGHLPRLALEYYLGRNFIHWTLTVDQRATGWLTPALHAQWQLTLLHASARYQLTCPAYVLMPDHVHVLWIGLRDDSNQRIAIEFLRKHLSPTLAPTKWQQQVHDHVLREHERERGAFQTVAQYILENPVRAGLAGSAPEYRFVGCCIPGYPELEVSQTDYWERFWRVYNFIVER